MAPDRSRPPVPPLAGMRQPDGTVIVPASIAGEVLRALLFAVTVRDNIKDVDQLNPAGRRLVSELYAAADQHRRLVPAEALTDTVSVNEDQPHTAMTVREAALVMGCSPSWVRQLLAAGRLPGRRSGGVWIVHLNRPLADSQVPQRSA